VGSALNGHSAQTRIAHYFPEPAAARPNVRTRRAAKKEGVNARLSTEIDKTAALDFSRAVGKTPLDQLLQSGIQFGL